jgi:hypothetical protein
LAITNIFNTEISINGRKESIFYHRYKPEYILDVTDESINLYAIGILTSLRKKKPFEKIHYSNIKDVTISVCRRNYGIIAAIIVNEYHLDLILNLNNGESYQLESQSWNNFLKLIDKLYLENVTINDQLNIYKGYAESGKRFIQELDMIFDDLADTYHLKHYRLGNKRLK